MRVTALLSFGAGAAAFFSLPQPVIKPVSANAATDAIRHIDAEQSEAAKARLIAAQQEAEEIYITPPLEALREKLRRPRR